MAFTYLNNYQASSQIPTITIPEREVAVYRADGKPETQIQPATEIPRMVFWDNTINSAVCNLPGGNNPTYIATGGGYNAFDNLITDLRTSGAIPLGVPNIAGGDYRNHPAFEAEKNAVRATIAAELGEGATPEAVNQVLTSFYSDEVNTRIAKEVVMAGLCAGKSSIYNSASLYPDTLERVELAKAHGVRTRLIAGDQDFMKAIEAKKGSIEPGLVVTSFQKFAERFEKELAPAFDEIQLYNTDQSPPKLIAEKKGPGQELLVRDEQLYGEFTAKRFLEPEKYKSPTADLNVLYEEWKQRAPQQDRGQGK